jgi:hypothetical protein
MPDIGWTENVSKQFETFIVGFLKATPSLYNLLNRNGNVRNLADGIQAFQYLETKQVDGGKMSLTIHKHNIITPQWKEIKVSLLYINSMIRISRSDVDAYKNGQWLRGDLIKDTMDMVMPTMLNQVDQFCAWGDKMKDPVAALDTFAGTETFKGLFNSGTTLNAGIGIDNNMTALGDFRNTNARYRKALRTAAHELGSYIVLSDMDTMEEADNGAIHQYTDVGVSEYDRCLEKKYLQTWMDSVNFTSNTSTQHRIAMIAPKQITPTPIGGKNITNNFELVVSYPFRVMPVDGGQMDIDKYYNWAITWLGAFVVYKDTAIQHSGDLTLT